MPGNLKENALHLFLREADKEGYKQIAAIFMETAEQEKEHAKRMFKYLEGGMLEITSTFPAGVIGNTAENLEAAAAGENEEWTELYPHFADVAEEEGFKEIATIPDDRESRGNHEERYLKLLQRVKDETVFLRDEKIEWQCRNCGYVHEGKKALKTCPACLHSQAYFEVKCDKYY